MGWQPRHLRRGTHANDDFPYFLEQYRGGRQRWPSGPAVAVAGFFALVTSLLMFKRVAAVFRGQGGKRPWHTLALALAPVLTAWAASTGVLHVRSFLYADGVAAVCEAAALRAHAGLALPDDAWAAADGDVCRRTYDVVATTLVALRTMVSCEPREEPLFSSPFLARCASLYAAGTVALAIAAFAILEISSLDRAVHLYFELLTYCRSAAFVVAAAAVATIEARNDDDLRVRRSFAVLAPAFLANFLTLALGTWAPWAKRWRYGRHATGALLVCLCRGLLACASAFLQRSAFPLDDVDETLLPAAGGCAAALAGCREKAACPTFGACPAFAPGDCAACCPTCPTFAECCPRPVPSEGAYRTKKPQSAKVADVDFLYPINMDNLQTIHA
jgi:hypothetical protein